MWFLARVGHVLQKWWHTELYFVSLNGVWYLGNLRVSSFIWVVTCILLELLCILGALYRWGGGARSYLVRFLIAAALGINWSAPLLSQPRFLIGALLQKTIQVDKEHQQPLLLPYRNGLSGWLLLLVSCFHCKYQGGFQTILLLLGCLYLMFFPREVFL